MAAIHDEHRQASAAPAMFTQQEIQQLMQPSAAWPFHAHDDGWYRAHSALRADMQDFSSAVKAVLLKLESGSALPPWMVSNIQKWWPIFVSAVHRHHDKEEEVVFPELSKVFTVPPKMSDDHPSLMRALADITAAVKSLSAASTSPQQGLPQWRALSKLFEEMRASMCEHLQEEEDVGLMLLRKHMTAKQFKPIEKKLVKHASLDDIGWVLRPFANDAERVRWLTNVACIPTIVQKLIMLPTCRRWQKNVGRLLEEVIAGQQHTAAHKKNKSTVKQAKKSYKKLMSCWTSTADVRASVMERM